MPPDDRQRLADMRWAADKVLTFAAGKDRAAFDADDMLQFACVRGLEIIGEAASKVSGETRERMPDVPWSSIVGMRHRIVHAYADLDLDVVWLTVTKELPILARALKARERG